MTMKTVKKLNSEAFFKGYLAKLGKITQKQVDAIERFLSAMEKFGLTVAENAYIFATVYHETAKTFLPIEEYGKGRGRKYGKPVNGKKYYGRGYVQLTWDFNYEKATKELKKQRPDLVAEFEKKSGQKFDMLAIPEQALDHDISTYVLVLGSLQGWFTGKKIGDYINARQTDYINARRVINGVDHARMIANTAVKFEEIIGSSIEPEPVIIVEPVALASEATPEPKVSTFTKVGTAVTGLTGLGINMGAMVETQINRLTPAQVLYLCLSLALVGLAVFWYRQSANNAHKERMTGGGKP
jgi:hypothetical protein